MSFLIRILQALFLVRIINLTQIAQAFPSSVKEESVYRRIQRFFKGFSFDMSFVVVLACKFFTWQEPCVLLLDRTNWKWGKIHINILVLSIEHFGIGIPIFWMVLNTGGNSATKDRIKILERVISTIGKKNIRVLLTDRVIGVSWFRFLIEQGIPFVIRIKQNSMVDGVRKGYPVSVAVCWAYKIGELKAREVPIAVKKHGRKCKSLFRVGLDLIRKMLFREDKSPLTGLSVFYYLGLPPERRLYEICRVQRMKTIAILS